jgi:hypothetical protein
MPSRPAPPSPGEAHLPDAVVRLLAHGGRTTLTPTPAAAPLAPLRLAPAAWAALVRTAAAERLLGLLVAAADDGTLVLDAAQRAELSRIEVGLSLAALGQEHAIAQVAEAFATAGLEARLLKGHAVAPLAYRDPRHRQSGDVDVAVPAAQFAAAESVLLRRGASPLPSHELGPHFAHLEKARTFRLDHGVEIDLHSHVHGEVARYAITETDLFADPRVVTVGSATMLAPPLPVVLVHASIHLSSVRTRLSTMADLIRLLHRPDLDTDAAVAVAARGGSLPVLAWAARRADLMVGIPEPVMARLDQIRFRRADRVAAALVLDRPHCRVLVQVADEPARRWPGLAREVLWPSRSFLAVAHRGRLAHLRHIGRSVIQASTPVLHPSSSGGLHRGT